MRYSPRIVAALALVVFAALVAGGCAGSSPDTEPGGGSQAAVTPSATSAPASSTGAPLIGDNPSPVMTGVVEYANGEVRALGTLEKMHGAGSAKWVIRDTLPFMSRMGTIIAVLDVTGSPVPESELEKGTYVLATGKLGVPASDELPLAPVIRLDALHSVELPVESP